MKSERCIVCLNAKGARVCIINDNSLICSICCAKTRNCNCEGCIYYAQAEKYAKEKALKQKSKKFIMAIDPEVNEKVDQALAMAEKGKKQSGEKILTELLNEHPHIDMVQYGMGVICLMQGYYDRALSYFDKAIEINPYFVEAWFNKGAAHQKRLELREIIKAYQKVVELGDPSEDFVGHAKSFVIDFEKQIRETCGLSLDGYFEAMDIFNDAYAAMEKMEWRKAVAGFRKVLALDPQHTQSYGNLGICYAHLGCKQEALNALDKALELDPKYEPAIVNRKVITSLEEGEELSIEKFVSVDYYKDYSLEKRSLIRRMFG
ncbi:MAG: tetratricopeptide repeat protein [bacterium]